MLAIEWQISDSSLVSMGMFLLIQPASELREGKGVAQMLDSNKIQLLQSPASPLILPIIITGAQRVKIIIERTLPSPCSCVLNMDALTMWNWVKQKKLQ